MRRYLWKKLFGLSFLLLCFFLFCGQTIMAASRNFSPGHVYVEMRRVEQFIDALGLHMGIPDPEPLGVKVTDVSPHDVYFQLRTLVIKANRLSFELSRISNDFPPLPNGRIRPGEVLAMASKALEIMSAINQKLQLPSAPQKVVFEEGIVPSDVFMVALRVNRHLNSLLERRFSPAEAYEVVNLAIAYASNLLAQYPEAKRLPNKPLFEKNKRPLDVYYRLQNCLQLIEQINQTLGLDILTMDISTITEGNIGPSDVYDVATLLVARLDFLNKNEKIRTIPRETFYPGRKVPSDVYQQAGILEQQLTTLLAYQIKKTADR